MTSCLEELYDCELFWRDRYDFFKAKGYTLRPRYHPDWKPSWMSDVDPRPGLCEDSIGQLKGALLDARRAHGDGRDVFIKKIDLRTNPHEAEIALYLSSLDRQSEDRNHCVPVLDNFADEQDGNFHYIVMPLLRPFNAPKFTSVGEVIDFVDQTLQGLSFMHDHHVAHRDCADRNIVMDASDLYRDGWHPMAHWRSRDGRNDASSSRRRSDAEIKYYFIDFGLSTRFPPGQPIRLVTGQMGRILAPEQRSGLPYDPFKLDIYDLGYVFQENILNEFTGIGALGGLVELMMQPDPNKRPDAHQALHIWKCICSSPPFPARWTRLRSEAEGGSNGWLVPMVDFVVGAVGL